MYENYLKHYGVLGMHWGRRSRNGIIKNQSTASRQINADDEGLRRLNNGEHSSFGTNSKRQAKYDERDKKYLENRKQAMQSIVKMKEAKSEMKAAFKDLPKWAGISVEEANANQKKYEKAADASMKYVHSKVAARRDFQTSAKGKSRAELAAYTKEMRKSGLPGSALDISSGGRSTRLAQELNSQKGKEYADKILSKTRHQLIAQGVAGMALIGGVIVADILGNR